ncbi:MAG: hypothetical protein A4E53_03222 [Pelotomaculum sp. PtaB.Bin104]|nr:MAG: hypothetical protein A4E53_03222 [Pelotomaculum sp. PtaB.Bin104]
MPNRLTNEKSPYLLQHKDNPVDWFPWGNEAFEKANREDKPIFLSIGYSTCHWCHVMERESFEDKEVAGILNSSFIAIKVDREERPDIDHVYMSVCQAMTGQGGWPLTILMTPEKKPFFAGTYFPKHSRMGLPGLVDILTEVSDRWEHERDTFHQAGEQITGAISNPAASLPGGRLTRDTLDKAFKQLRGCFEQHFGGFSSAPKFPMPSTLLFLLRYWKRSGEPDALAMVEKTLEAMSRGGIYDHVGFGFSRYSTDPKWLVPHFEKMLYDNALLALAYTEAFQATGKDYFALIAKEIFTYVLRDMTAPEGGFYSAEDADSEGVEGKFYVWTTAEIKEVLGEKDGELFCHIFDITAGGNFEGHSIPNLISASMEKAAKKFAIGPGELASKVEKMRQKVFAAREKRVHPYKDDKILTAWNGLMIAALAKGAAVFDEPVYRQAAAGAVDFIFQHLRRPDGRLLARFRDGEADFPAYLDDYAFLTWGLLELYEATFEAAYLEKAAELVKQKLDLFWDQENSGFYFNGNDSEQLIARPKEIYDGALPSGNSVALANLLRLARLTGDEALTETAEKLVGAFADEVKQAPHGYPHFLIGVDFLLGPAREIVIVGEAEDPWVNKMLQTVCRKFLPDAVVVFHPFGTAGEDIEKIAPFLKEQRPIKGKATAYICQNYACQAPVTEYNEFVDIL